MLWTRPLQPLTLIAIITITTGCQTVGQYFANRGRDLADCITIEGGVGYGFGAEIKLAGLVHVAGGACYYGAPPVGLRYGELVPSSESGDKDTGFLGIPLVGLVLLHGAPPYLHVSVDDKEEHGCYWLLPGLASYYTEVSESWIWTDPKSGWSRLHAFDVEAHLFLGVVGVRVGFSPGEFLDFLLGWVGVDIAGDDEGSISIPSDLEIIRDPDTPPGAWEEAALRAAADGGISVFHALLRGMLLPSRERAALEGMDLLGDDAVRPLIWRVASTGTHPPSRVASRKALKHLLNRGSLSDPMRKIARNALQGDRDESGGDR
ncbi:MAG: hypothetical protein O7H41_10820 [Planctomycetota bacterium]|nr:hypothetical protein [Planctomycetota bacterium]